MYFDALPSEIIAGALYLGSERHVTREIVNELGITHIVNITTNRNSGFFSDKDKIVWQPPSLNVNRHIHRMDERLKKHNITADVLFCELLDHPSADISVYFSPSYDFIRNAIDGGGVVLVHCAMGLSRSPTLVTAFLMKHYQMTLQYAIHYVLRCRPLICPNNGFMRHLLQLERQIHGQISVNEEWFTDDFGFGVCSIPSPPSISKLSATRTVKRTPIEAQPDKPQFEV